MTGLEDEIRRVAFVGIFRRVALAKIPLLPIEMDDFRENDFAERETSQPRSFEHGFRLVR